jgi:tetratricopeptide (TPR) repeat protein
MGLFNILGRNVNLNALVFINKGDEQFQNNDFINAIQTFTKAIELDSNNWYPLFKRGKSYQLSNNLDSAIKDYLQGIKLDDNLDFNRGLGESYLMKSNYDYAIKFFLKSLDKCLELEQIDALSGEKKYGRLKASLMNNIAVAYYKSGNKKEALECTQTGIEYEPNYSGNYGIRGAILLEMGRQGDAIECLTKGAKLGDKRAQSILDNFAV